jgi:hypothetical protein
VGEAVHEVGTACFWRERSSACSHPDRYRRVGPVSPNTAGSRFYTYCVPITMKGRMIRTRR